MRIMNHFTDEWVLAVKTQKKKAMFERSEGWLPLVFLPLLKCSSPLISAPFSILHSLQTCIEENYSLYQTACPLPPIHTQKVKCTECDYESFHGIKNHYDRHHSTTRPQFPCPKCSYIAKQNCDLKAHFNAVHEKVRIKCELCEKDFARGPALILHRQKVHEGVDKSVQCSICEQKLSSKSKLKRHINDTHLKLKPFECPSCKYKATTMIILNTHIKAMHEGVKFQCTFCDYKTSLKSNVGKHEESKHSGKKFRCESCSYSTTIRQSLNSHRKAKHTENNKV